MVDEILIDISEEDSLPKLLNTWSNIQKIKKDLLINEEKIRNKIKIFLKEHKWDKYEDPYTKMSVKFVKGQTETFDKNQLKLMLSEAQYLQARKVTTYEKLIIMTLEDKERLKNILKPKL